MTNRTEQTVAARWLRELASYVDYAQFRRVWLHPVTEQAEQGFVAACYENVAQRANSEGEYFLAHDAANHGLRAATAAEFPPHRLLTAKVTALARSGATSSAQRVLDEFLQHHEADGAVCSAQARLLRDRGLAAPPKERRLLLREAVVWAAKAKEFARAEGGDWAYPANQEVQFQFLAGEHDLARSGAMAVIDFVGRRGESIWNETNLAEMHLVRGDLELVRKHYARAAEFGLQSPGDLAANRAVAALLLKELSGVQPVDMEVVETWFPKPVLIVFAGHIPDAVDRPEPRLPESVCRRDGKVARALAAQVERLKAVEGICANAPGGDILFAEAVLAAGKRLTLVEPFQSERVRTVATASGHDWLERLAAVSGKATRTESVACADDADEAAQCEYGNRVMVGSAMLRAKRVNGRLVALALWDDADAGAPKRGGTGHFVALCREAGVPVEIINARSFFP